MNLLSLRAILYTLKKYEKFNENKQPIALLKQEGLLETLTQRYLRRKEESAEVVKTSLSILIQLSHEYPSEFTQP